MEDVLGMKICLWMRSLALKGVGLKQITVQIWIKMKAATKKGVTKGVNMSLKKQMILIEVQKEVNQSHLNVQDSTAGWSVTTDMSVMTTGAIYANVNAAMIPCVRSTNA